ncbi:snoRNA-binding protein [Cyanidiococcus yangmingshanensis]|uniref:H/ACA ribonucleoprotein complex subunit 2 n=1 Tax=Cyanidiococcus yangmingshanensis TaxID=2690220 RepID=A0A7J7IIC4_9RHOD|nr:snoRNA-binding protein [Cyanidiococcus yangmingshanensis]
MPDKKRPRSALGPETEANDLLQSSEGANDSVLAGGARKSDEDQVLEIVTVAMEQKLRCSPIAHPLAGRKVTKRVMKLAKKLAARKQLRRGVKEVVKSIRRGARGFCVMGADVAPVDVIAHIPVLCEEAGILYCFVPSREVLGTAALLKRPTSVIFLPLIEDTDDEEEKKLQRKCLRDLEAMHIELVSTLNQR